MSESAVPEIDHYKIKGLPLAFMDRDRPSRFEWKLRYGASHDRFDFLLFFIIGLESVELGRNIDIYQVFHL